MEWIRNRVILIWSLKTLLKDQMDIFISLIWEYSSMNDPMWDLAALFLESEFTSAEEEDF